MTRGMCSTVYFRISVRSSRARSTISLTHRCWLLLHLSSTHARTSSSSSGFPTEIAAAKRSLEFPADEMDSQLRNSNDSLDVRPLAKEGASWSTTETPFSPEEEDAIVTLVVVVIGVVVAIVILFSMGIFIDCKHQKKDSLKRRKLRLKMPPLARARKSPREDVKSLASDMCPNGATDNDFRTRDAIV